MSDPGRRTASEEDLRADRVRALLRDASDLEGFVPFDRFMDIALYGEGVGFYSREASPFGRSGDYYTAAHASPLFGRSMAERIKSVAAASFPDAPFRVVEVGPGDGTLGESVLADLGATPTVRERVEYVMAERSGALAVRAFDRLRAAGEAAKIPVRASDGVGADGPFRGFVIANEVLDAQPTRRLRWDGKRWQELGIRVTDRGIEPAAVPSVRPVPPPALPDGLEPGTVVEVSPMAEGLLREVADHLESGLCLVLDYGMAEPELVVAHPFGTLAGVRRHRFVTDPLADPGSTDLSTFVNFTRVRAAAAAAGLREVAFRSQAEALGAWGFPGLLEAAVRSAESSEAEVRIRLSAKNLLFGFERFCALELAPPAGEPGRTAPAAT